jgi:DNA repair protein RadA
MLALEIDRLTEIDDSIKDQLKQAGFNSIKDIVIRGPVQVAKSAEIAMEEAESICNKASFLLEQLGVIPNNISEASNNRLTLNKEYIKTGSSDLDSIFGGKGIETGSVTEFYGRSGSGKTQICQTLCVTVQQLCSHNKAMFIDTEGKFRPERIAQIAIARNLDSTKICMNIKYVRTLNSARQESILQNDLPSRLENDSNLKLLVVDSIIGHYRSEYSGPSMVPQRQHRLSKIMHLLQNIAQAYNVAVVITSQVQASFDQIGGSSDKPTGGNVMAHSSTFRIQLRGSNPDRLYAKLIKSPCFPMLDSRFAVDERGITDVEY